MLMATGIRKNPSKTQNQFVSQGKKQLPEPDQVLLEKPEFANAFLDVTFGEAFRSGVGGVSQEAALYARPWRFRLQDIPAEVHLWHGELDRNVLVSVGRYVADAIPNCYATFFEKEGHMSLPLNHIREILSVLVA